MSTTERQSLSADEQRLIDEVSAERLIASTEAIARYERLSGTEEEAQAFDWIAEQLRALGLPVERHSHPALVSWPESAELTILGVAPETIPVKTHAFAASAEGLEGELVEVGRGTAEEMARAEVRGKIALVEGIIAPNHNLRLEEAGALSSVWIAGSRLHERGLSPVWGTPTPETAGLLPKTPSISLTDEQGERVKAALTGGPLRVRLTTQVYQGWRDLPLVTADLTPGKPGPESDTFILFSGHVDSWYFGAMDNGSANATQLEVARILAGRRDTLRRGIRLAFWSGHSHARYAGSAWYGDTFWHELHDRCVAHVNVDSPGAIGATILSEGNSMAEVREFVSDAIEPIAGQRLSARRYGRSGDQSFWGHGFPAMLMSLSEQSADAVDPALAALHHQISGGASRGGGLGWWWHTPEDTVDKLDPTLLRRDAQIYTLLVYRLATVKLLPFDYCAVVSDLRRNVATLQEQSGEHFDLNPVVSELERLDRGVNSLNAALADRCAQVGDETAAAVNRALMDLGRALIPVDYTATGMWGQDLAVPTSPLPSLQSAGKLAVLASDRNRYEFERTRLTRERNRVVYGLKGAERAVDRALRLLGAASAQWAGTATPAPPRESGPAA